MDDANKPVESCEYIVRPEGYVISEDSARIHGITHDIAIQRGVSLSVVLDAIETSFQKASIFVAHNIAFDTKILDAEFHRAGRATRMECKSKRLHCTMQASTKFCNLPGLYGAKWPTLQELHTTLFKTGFDGAHHALVDVEACVRCYIELRRLNVMT